MLHSPQGALASHGVVQRILHSNMIVTKVVLAPSYVTLLSY
jgi:hypothetical protein